MSNGVCVWQGRLDEDGPPMRVILKDEVVIVETQVTRVDALGVETITWSEPISESCREGVVRRALRDMHDEIERVRVRLVREGQ